MARKKLTALDQIQDGEPGHVTENPPHGGAWRQDPETGALVLISPTEEQPIQED